MQPSKVHDEILCDPAPPPPPGVPLTPECGYKKCCVRVEMFDDGSVELSDDDAASGSVGTIKLRPEAVKRLVELLSK